MIKIQEGKKYLVTGGSGFLGGEVTRRILEGGGKVSTISRDEGLLIKLKQLYPEVEIYTGDISDRLSVRRLMKGVTGVFHLAAFKHVGLAEIESRECTLSNVYGSINVAEEAVNEGVEFVIGISTDKAAQISGVYGASKFIMEKVFEQFDTDYDTTFRIVRYGNVLYSTGSVLCKWRDLLKEGKEVIVTEPKATRFFWTLEQAVDLIWECLENAPDSKPYVPEMKSMSIENLLKAMANKYLPDGEELKIKQIGLQPGENFHERVIETGKYSNETEQFTVEEIQEFI